MSRLKKPEIKPDQDIHFDEAVKMLDEATEAQEESLTRLTDIERDKVKYILKYLGEEAQSAGKSVDEILGTIEKYRLLLELKQQQTRKLTGYPNPASLSPPPVRHALPEGKPEVRQTKTPSGEPTRAGQGVIPGGFSVPRPIAPVSPNMFGPMMTSAPPMTASSPMAGACPSPSSSAAAARPCVRQPSLAGTARGVISNPEDSFYGKTAVLRAFIVGTDIADQSVRYTVNGDDGEIRFYAAGKHIKTTRPDGCRNGLVISGEGTVRIQRQDQPECAGRTAFSLVVQNTNRGLEFRMQIASPDTCPAHDSGTVTVKQHSDMCLRLA